MSVRLRVFDVVTTTVASVFAFGSLPALAQNTDDEGVFLEPIIILGERQEKTFLETTSSVTVFSEEQLDREAGQTIGDIVESAPNVLTTSISEIPDIRGLEGGGPGGLVNVSLGGTQPRVPLIIDEIARPASLQNSDFNSAWDVEQVEVFKGPQTTLRGRAASAGAIVVKTKDPTFDPEFAAQFVTDIDRFEEPTYTVNGVASGGLIDDLLAVRLVGEFQTGEDPREFIGIPAGFADDADELNDFRQTRLRGKFLLTPLGEDGPLQITALAEGQFGQIPQTRGTVEAPFSEREINFLGTGQRLFDTDAFTGAVDATYQIGTFGELRSISSFSTTEFDSLPEQPDPLFFDFREEIVNQDFIFKFGEKTDRVSGLIGFNYTRREQSVAIDNVIVPAPIAPNQLTIDGLEQQISGFADLRVRVVGGLDLLVGGRILSDQETRITTSDLTEGISPVIPIGSPPAVNVFEENEIDFLPKAGLQYAFNDEHSVAFTYREGRSSGGSSINLFLGTPADFKSEDVQTYELSYRFQSANGKYVFGATGFFNEFDDLQLFAETVPGVPFTLQVVNFEDARSLGAEFSGAAAVTDEVTINAALGLLNTEITGDGGAGFVGNDFGSDPTVSFSAGVVYEPEIIEGLSFDADVSYTSEYFNNFENVAGERVGGFVLLDFGVSYERDNFKLRAFIKNAAASDGITSLAVTDPTSSFAEITPAISGGISLTARF
ncbi:MAG: TonB-dependent receptor [Pseudomonadota bacterium]